MRDPDEAALAWLLASDEPGIRYRTRTVSERALADVIAVSNRQRAQAEQARLSEVMEKTERRL